MLCALAFVLLYSVPLQFRSFKPGLYRDLSNIEEEELSTLPLKSVRRSIADISSNQLYIRALAQSIYDACCSSLYVFFFEQHLKQQLVT